MKKDRFFLRGGFSVLLTYLFFAVSVQAGTSNEWHVVKSKNRGTLAERVVLRSVTVASSSEGEGIKEAWVEGVSFPGSAYAVQVIDNATREKTASQVLPEQHFLAGINGGYFHPDGTPLGLVISHGKLIHAQEKARLLSGFFVGTAHELSLVRVGETIPPDATEVIQAGPFLLDHGNPVTGLENTRRARRTFLATDHHGLWMMGITSPITLAETPHVLLAAAPLFFPSSKIERALNVDGGSSSALWVGLQPEPFSQEELGRVRNFLGLKSRE